MRVIPAIDLRGGRCVRLRQGDFTAETVYASAPLALLAVYLGHGARWVHVVDLDGARDGVARNAETVRALCAETGARVQVGGGVRDERAVEAWLEAGAARVVVGSLAVEDPGRVEVWLGRYGPDRLCLAFDVRPGDDGTPVVQTRGWRRSAGTDLWAALGRYPPGRVRHVLCTDASRDGTLDGPNLALYREARRRRPDLAWQASGGVRDGRDLDALGRLGLSAAVCGRAVLDGLVGREELARCWPGG